MEKSVFVIIPNYNGADELAASIESILKQTLQNLKLIIVDNGSVDDSRKIIERYEKRDDRVEKIYSDKNYGFTGGVNPGFVKAMEAGAEFVAPFNNDAIADPHWLEELVNYLKKHPECAIAACSLQSIKGDHYDSTGDMYTVWGLPFPRGRGESTNGQFDKQRHIFGASGGASVYRVECLHEIGIYDQDFFAYYEDIDISFRAQLAGWKVAFVPSAIVYHAYNTTSSKIKGFTTYQSIKNLPFVVIKDVPARLLPTVAPRFLLAYSFFIFRAFSRGQGYWALKGLGRSLVLLPKKCIERYRIQKNRKVPVPYIYEILTHDLPPNAHKLRTLRTAWRKLVPRGNA